MTLIQGSYVWWDVADSWEADAPFLTLAAICFSAALREEDNWDWGWWWKHSKKWEYAYAWMPFVLQAAPVQMITERHNVKLPLASGLLHGMDSFVPNNQASCEGRAGATVLWESWCSSILLLFLSLSSNWAPGERSTQRILIENGFGVFFWRNECSGSSMAWRTQTFIYEFREKSFQRFPPLCQEIKDIFQP